jgi:membrane-associated HD superfamily phosphohydrolase
MMERSTLVRGAIFLATVAAASAILVLGTGSNTPTLEVGDVADQTYVADRSDTVEDVEATARAQQEARDAVEPPFYTDTNVEQAVYDSVGDVFAGLRELTLVDTSSIPDTAHHDHRSRV